MNHKSSKTRFRDSVCFQLNFKFTLRSIRFAGFFWQCPLASSSTEDVVSELVVVSFQRWKDLSYFLCNLTSWSDKSTMSFPCLALLSSVPSRRSGVPADRNILNEGEWYIQHHLLVLQKCMQQHAFWSLRWVGTPGWPTVLFCGAKWIVCTKHWWTRSSFTDSTNNIFCIVGFDCNTFPWPLQFPL